MKKYLLILISLLVVIPISSCTQISELVPKALASKTQATVQEVKVSSTDVFSEIQHNIDLVSNLKAKIEQDKINGQPLSLDDVIRDIKVVSDSYSKLSGQHATIKKNLLQKISDIEDLETKVNDEINTLQKRRVDYVNQLNQVQDPNPDIVASRRAALTQAIKYVDAQIKLWIDFNGVEANIIAQMDTIQKTIDSFLSVIDSSAILFKEGLNLLQLQKNINDALSLFTQDMPRMQQLTTDMQKSWANLDYLVNTLTSISSKSPVVPK